MKMAVDPVSLKFVQLSVEVIKESKFLQYLLIGIGIACACLTTVIASFFMFTTIYQSTTPGVSDNLVMYIKLKEGFSALPYRGLDSQNETIGYGHMIRPGETFTYLTKPKAHQLLIQDLSMFIGSVRRNFANVPLTQNQFDALVSLCYNLGPNIWPRISLTGDIKKDASMSVIEQDFLSLDHVNGVVVLGLYNRRMEEFEIYKNGNYPKY